MPNVIVKNRSQVFGYYDHNMTVMFERIGDHLEKRNKYSPRQKLWYIRAKQVFLATGSIERPIVLEIMILLEFFYHQQLKNI
jgi:hypothetical protein